MLSARAVNRTEKLVSFAMLACCAVVDIHEVQHVHVAQILQVFGTLEIHPTPTFRCFRCVILRLVMIVCASEIRECKALVFMVCCKAVLPASSCGSVSCDLVGFCEGLLLASCRGGSCTGCPLLCGARVNLTFGRGYKCSLLKDSTLRKLSAEMNQAPTSCLVKF